MISFEKFLKTGFKLINELPMVESTLLPSLLKDEVS